MKPWGYGQCVSLAGGLSLDGPLGRYNVSTSWDEWSTCDRCGKVGLRKRLGKCQLKTTVRGLLKPPGVQDALNVSLPMMGPSCRSALLRRHPAFGKLSNMADFVQTEYCKEPCDETFDAGHKMSTVNKSFFEPLHPEEEADEPEATELPPSDNFKRTERSGTSITLVCPGRGPAPSKVSVATQVVLGRERASPSLVLSEEDFLTQEAFSFRGEHTSWLPVSEQAGNACPWFEDFL
ncbi:hypothetical protein HPB47_001313, partial [Ixodes persulcatus]